MSIKIKITVLIFLLLVLSLGATIVFISYGKFEPVLHRQTMDGINAQLSYLERDLNLFFHTDLSQLAPRSPQILNLTFSLKRFLADNPATRRITVYQSNQQNMPYALEVKYDATIINDTLPYRLFAINSSDRISPPIRIPGAPYETKKSMDTVSLLKILTDKKNSQASAGWIEIALMNKSIREKVNTIIYEGFLISLAPIFLSILFGLIFAIYLIHPIQKLDKGVGQIFKDLSYRIKIGRHDEYGRLADAFNRLAGQLIEELTKYEHLYREATEDGLTKLMVRRYFLDLLEKELTNGYENKRPTSFLLTDIDHFKTFNDTYGHQVGDEVLAEVARTILDTIRKNRVRHDTAGRYGGEEFGVILPDSDRKAATELAERMRQAVENLAVQHSKKPLKVTISIGISCAPLSNIRCEELIQKADQALYRAKDQGRNRVVADE